MLMPSLPERQVNPRHAHAASRGPPCSLTPLPGRWCGQGGLHCAQPLGCSGQRLAGPHAFLHSCVHPLFPGPPRAPAAWLGTWEVQRQMKRGWRPLPRELVPVQAGVM